MKQILRNMAWVEELLPPETESAPKQGGIAYFLEMKLVMIIVEKPGSYEHKGISYPFEIWNGVILPVEYKKQSAFFLKFSFLENHPANKDWLYIPYDSEDFEDEVKQYVREIIKGNPLLGLPVKISGPTKAQAAAANNKKKAPKKVKADKKKENHLILSLLNRKPEKE